MFVAPVALADVKFTGDFESGRILQENSSHDGFFVHTLPDPQVSALSFSSSSGGFAPWSKLDTRVVKTEFRGSTMVKPRAGKYFLRSALYKNKNYRELNGGENKPRSKIYVNGDKNAVEFDEEGYLGFSIFLPRDWEHETGTYGDRGSTQLLQVQSEGASWTLLALRIYVPKGDTKAHWFLTHYHSDTAVRGGKRRDYDLGRVTADLGKWTDFVLRYRFNPFATKTDASTYGGPKKVFKGNQGILQLWKASGDSRQMLLTNADLVDEPVGLVPHRTEKIHWHFRIYKYGWHKNRSNVKGPVWVGFDEIRDGRVIANGTTYADVHPAGTACTNRCPDPAARPRPPQGVTID